MDDVLLMLLDALCSWPAVAGLLSLAGFCLGAAAMKAALDCADVTPWREDAADAADGEDH